MLVRSGHLNRDRDEGIVLALCIHFAGDETRVRADEARGTALRMVRMESLPA